MPAFVHDTAYRALGVLDRIPAGCIGVIVTREDFDPHLRHAEVAIVDTADREPQLGELYALGLHQHRHGRAKTSLAIVQAYRREGALWCRFGFPAPGLVPLCDGPLHRRRLAREVRRSDHRRHAADVAGVPLMSPACACAWTARDLVAEWAEQQLRPWRGAPWSAPEVRSDSEVVVDVCAGGARLRERSTMPAPYFARAHLYETFLNGVARRHALPRRSIVIDVADEAPASRDRPIFTFQREVGSPNLLLPDPDFLVGGFYDDPRSFALPDTTAFIDKKPSAIFVGSTAGGGHLTVEKLRADPPPRIQLARFAKAHLKIIVRLPNLTQCDEAARQALLEEGYGGPPIHWRDQVGHRYLISIDGNGAACSRIFLSLASNSVPIKLRSGNELFYFPGLEDGVHYLGIGTFDEMPGILAADRHRHASVAEAGRLFAEAYLTRPELERYTAMLLRWFAGGA